jgi:hypothetical protein
MCLRTCMCMSTLVHMFGCMGMCVCELRVHVPSSTWAGVSKLLLCGPSKLRAF